MNWIQDNLYLSGRCEAACRHCLTEKQITHIITVDSEQPPALDGLCDNHACSIANHGDKSEQRRNSLPSPSYVRLHIYALDVPHFPLLEEFPRCFKFIDEAFKASPQNNVLVHCHVGVSRSVTITLGYLMRAHQLSTVNAIKLVRSRKPDIEPNTGFEKQLILFEEMGWKLDYKSAKFLAFRAKTSVLLEDTSPQPSEMLSREQSPSSSSSGCLESFTASADDEFEYSLNNDKIHSSMLTHTSPSILDGLSDASDVTIQSAHSGAFTDPSTEPILNKRTGYKCRSCRTEILFNSTDLQAHEQNHDSAVNCSSVFLSNVPDWMSNQIDGLLQGRLVCGKCTAKLGSFNWTGERCSCGEWFTPAFQIHRSKVDEVIEFVNPD